MIRWRRQRRVTHPPVYLDTRQGGGIAPRPRPAAMRVRRWLPRLDLDAIFGGGQKPTWRR